MMWCQSCREEYDALDAGTCKECYEEASETEEELKREIEDLKSKVLFLRLQSPIDSDLSLSPTSSDVSLHASSDRKGTCPAVPAHRVVLMSRSPVFRAMLGSEMEESRSGVIKIEDVSYNVLCSFVQYMYTADTFLNEQLACELLILAEKYQVKHLKLSCERFMTSRINNENAVQSFAFAHRYNSKNLLEGSLSLILDNISTLTLREDYKDLVNKDPRLVVEIYEAYLSRQVNTAGKDLQTLQLQ